MPASLRPQSRSKGDEDEEPHAVAKLPKQFRTSEPGWAISGVRPGLVDPERIDLHPPERYLLR